MTDNELRRLARMIVQEQSRNEEWMNAFAKASSRIRSAEMGMVSAKRAAEILGISVWQLYRIKDNEDGTPRFTYVKGCSKSSPLRFDSSLLRKEYDAYLRMRNTAAFIIPLRKAQ